MLTEQAALGCLMGGKRLQFNDLIPTEVVEAGTGNSPFEAEGDMWFGLNYNGTPTIQPFHLEGRRLIDTYKPEECDSGVFAVRKEVDYELTRVSMDGRCPQSLIDESRPGKDPLDYYHPLKDYRRFMRSLADLEQSEDSPDPDDEYYKRLVETVHRRLVSKRQDHFNKWVGGLNLALENDPDELMLGVTRGDSDELRCARLGRLDYVGGALDGQLPAITPVMIGKNGRLGTPARGHRVTGLYVKVEPTILGKAA